MGKLDIAREYLHAPTYTLEAVDAFKALADECTWMRELIGPIHITEVAESTPYTTASDMFADINTGNFKVSNLNCVHPQWTRDENIAFRIVHDIIGHCHAKADFSWKGEIAAYRSQRRWHSDLAAEALYTEIVGQTACFSVDKVFPAQKVILLESRHDSIDTL